MAERNVCPRKRGCARSRPLPPPGGAAMTDDERYIIKTNIAHFQAMLQLDIDDEKRSVIKRLLAEAKDVLATDEKTQQ